MLLPWMQTEAAQLCFPHYIETKSILHLNFLSFIGGPITGVKVAPPLPTTKLPTTKRLSASVILPVSGKFAQNERHHHFWTTV